MIFLHIMDLIHLRSFLAVVDSGQITTAAERLNITQSALTRRLQQLEQHFGVKLLTRHRKGTLPTEMGKMVEAKARYLVTSYDQLREDVAVHQRLEAGTLRLGGGATAVSFILPQAIADFQVQYPNIHFQLKEAGSSEIAKDVASGRLEVGLVTLPVQARDLLVEPIVKDQIVLVAPKDHRLVGSQAIEINALDGLAFVGFEDGSAIRKIIETSLKAAGVEMNVVMELRSIPAILRMVATTGNLAFVSQLGVQMHPDICVIPVKGLAIERQLALISRKGGHLSIAASRFVERLGGLAE